MRTIIVLSFLIFSSPVWAGVSEDIYQAMWNIMLDCGKYTVIANEQNISTSTDKDAILDWFRDKGATPTEINALSSAWNASAETARFGNNKDVNFSKLEKTLEACETATRKGKR